MKSCMPIVVAAALLVAADEPKQGTKDSPPRPGWMFATEGSGIPSNQNSTDYAIRVAEINFNQNPILAGVIPNAAEPQPKRMNKSGVLQSKWCCLDTHPRSRTP
jgi:hypothetical protein